MFQWKKYDSIFHFYKREKVVHLTIVEPIKDFIGPAPLYILCGVEEGDHHSALGRATHRANQIFELLFTKT